jgi:hypothetical protein
MKEVFSRIDVVDKIILDPMCGTGTTLVVGMQYNVKRIIGTDIQPDFKEVKRKELVFNLNPIVFIEYGVDAKTSIQLNEYDILITDPPNPFMILGYSNIRHPRDLHMSGKEVNDYWKPRLVKNNYIGKKDDTIKYVKELFTYALINRKRVIANMFSTKSGKWSYLKEFESIFGMTNIYGQWYELQLKDAYDSSNR